MKSGLILGVAIGAASTVALLAKNKYISKLIKKN